MRLQIEWVVPMRSGSVPGYTLGASYSVDVSNFDELRLEIFKQTNLLPTEQRYFESLKRKHKGYFFGREIKNLGKLSDGDTIQLRKIAIPIPTLKLIQVQSEKISQLRDPATNNTTKKMLKF